MVFGVCRVVGVAGKPGSPKSQAGGYDILLKPAGASQPETFLSEALPHRLMKNPLLYYLQPKTRSNCPYNKDHDVFGFILGPPIFGNSHSLGLGCDVWSCCARGFRFGLPSTTETFFCRLPIMSI